MSKRSLGLRLALAAALAAPLAPAAHGQNLKGLYFGVGGGWVHYDIDYTAQVAAAYDPTPYGVLYADFGANNRGGFKTWLGYQFIPQLAAEIAYVNLGSPTASYATQLGSGVSIKPNTLDATYKLQGVNFSAVGTLPINEMFSVHAAIGAFYSQYKYSESGTTLLGQSYSFTAPNLWQTNLSYGAGASYNFDKQWSLRFDWDRFQDIGNEFALTDTGNGKFDHIDLFSFNLLYRF